MRCQRSLLTAAVLMAFSGWLGAAENQATLDNLQKAYAGEMNAKARYTEFAAQADKDGYKSIAALFRAAADSEAVHVQGFAATLTKMGAVPKAETEKPVVGTTKENLEAALKGETAEKNSMYPAFVKQAEEAKQADAVMHFKGAMASETEHAKFLQQALDDMNGWKDAGKEFAVCQMCGYTVMGKPPAKCPICAAPREKFREIM